MMKNRCIAGRHFGYPTYLARGTKKYPFDNFRFLDSGASIYEEDRPCPKCRQHRTAEGHDPCIANFPDVRTACCGHGNDDHAYIQLKNGKTLRGQKALDWVATKRRKVMTNDDNCLIH